MPRSRNTDRTSIHRWAVDRLGEDTASVEHDGDRVYDVPRAILPEGTREGDVLHVEATRDGDGVTVRVSRDTTATKRGKDESSRQLREAKGRGGKGDIAL
ncbi:MAG TPA: DUF3006 domain-containing protein [Gemmatimonadaceae bacterium]|nr:DUF3006 domain-containing protein [Gemmatimonadaceae bacterium]